MNGLGSALGEVCRTLVLFLREEWKLVAFTTLLLLWDRWTHGFDSFHQPNVQKDYCASCRQRVKTEEQINVRDAIPITPETTILRASLPCWRSYTFSGMLMFRQADDDHSHEINLPLWRQTSIGGARRLRPVVAATEEQTATPERDVCGSQRSLVVLCPELDYFHKPLVDAAFLAVQEQMASRVCLGFTVKKPRSPPRD